MATNKTVTVNVPIEVRKTGPDEYQLMFTDGNWSFPYSEDQARLSAQDGYPGPRAIVQAIDSGAFADPLPSSVGAHIYNPELKVHFLLTDSGDRCWASSQVFEHVLWHTAEEVQSYGEFEVMYDPEAQS